MKIINVLVSDSCNGIFFKILEHLEDGFVFDPTTEGQFDFDFETPDGVQYRVEPRIFSGQEEYVGNYDVIFRGSNGFFFGVNADDKRQMELLAKQLQSIAIVFDRKKKPPVYIFYTGKFKNMDNLYLDYPFTKVYRTVHMLTRGSFMSIMDNFCEEVK